jgi:hypothetical protein
MWGAGFYDFSYDAMASKAFSSVSLGPATVTTASMVPNSSVLYGDTKEALQNAQTTALWHGLGDN